MAFFGASRRNPKKNSKKNSKSFKNLKTPKKIPKNPKKNSALRAENPKNNIFFGEITTKKNNGSISGIPLVLSPPPSRPFGSLKRGDKTSGFSDYFDFRGLFRFSSKILMIFSIILPNPNARNKIQNHQLVK